MEDQGIVALFFERSEQAIVETDRKYGGYCYSIAYNILSSIEDSEESVSDTYLTAWNTIPPRKPSLLNAFLGKITRHISIDRWRRQSAQKRGGKEMVLALDELDECIPSDADPARRAELRGGHRVETLSVHDDLALRRALEHIDAAHERGFAGAAHADDAVDVAVWNGQGDVLERVYPSSGCFKGFA